MLNIYRSVYRLVTSQRLRPSLRLEKKIDGVYVGLCLRGAEPFVKDIHIIFAINDTAVGCQRYFDTEDLYCGYYVIRLVGC
jgi:hypothetical protein